MVAIIPDQHAEQTVKRQRRPLDILQEAASVIKQEAGHLALRIVAGRFLDDRKHIAAVDMR